MLCPNCNDQIYGWFDYYFLKTHKICYPCACMKYGGKKSVTMTNEVLALFKGINVKYGK
jgi:hypothetical protein